MFWKMVLCVMLYNNVSIIVLIFFKKYQIEFNQNIQIRTGRWNVWSREFWSACWRAPSGRTGPGWGPRDRREGVAGYRVHPASRSTRVWLRRLSHQGSRTNRCSGWWPPCPCWRWRSCCICWRTWGWPGCCRLYAVKTKTTEKRDV